MPEPQSRNCQGTKSQEAGDDKICPGEVPALDAVAEEFLARIRKGERPSLDEYRRKYPALSNDIEELFPTLASLEQFDPLATQTAAAGFAAGDIPERLGEYQLIREVGRGGMGIVFEAEHHRLKRRVALKVLPKDARRAEEARQRFLREARAAGQLHHSNIIPVFEVGEDQGLHYYAMQYIAGQNLDIVLDELRRMRFEASGNVSKQRSPLTREAERTQLRQSVSALLDTSKATAQTTDHDRHWAPFPSGTNLSTASTDANTSSDSPDKPAAQSNDSAWQSSIRADGDYFRRVARGCLQVASALEYAHRHGILHRDIKPSNLILDAEGVIWVSDFGLAKDGGEDLTHTGDIVGTLRYMAPERFQGQADARSDVYSLGLTLYELCTLRYAFDQDDRAQLVEQIARHDPTPPRQLRAEIPRDLETIIIKAIAREPSARYATAHQMAIDLERFLADRPVLARRITFMERFWRWSRRHPARAALVACIFIMCGLITCGAIYFGQLSRQHAHELEIENHRARIARDEAIAAEKNADAARQAAENASLSAKGHLFHAFVGQADANRTSGQRGQNYASVAAVRKAVNVLGELGLAPSKTEARKVALRSIAIAAMAQWDLQDAFAWKSRGKFVQFATDYAHRRIAATDDLGNIEIHSIEARPKTASVLPGSGRPAWKLSFSPNGEFLVANYHQPTSIRNPVTRVWNVESGQEILKVNRIPMGGAHCFSSNSEWFAMSNAQQGIDIYSTETGELTTQIQLDQLPRLLAFAHDDTQLIVVRSGSEVIEFWNWVDESAPFQTLTMESPVTSLDWEAGHQMLVVGSDRRNWFWPDGVYHTNEPNAGAVAIGEHRGRIVRQAIHPSGQFLLSYAWDGTTQMFDLRTRRKTLTIPGKQLNNDGFSPDGTTISFSTSSNDQYGLWQFPKSLPCTTLRNARHGGGQQVAQFHPNHSWLLAAPFVGTIEFWDHTSPKTLATIDCEGATDLLFRADGKSMLVSCDEGIVEFPVSMDGKTLEIGEPKLLLDTPVRSFDMNAEQSALVAALPNRRDAIVLDLATDQQRKLSRHVGMRNPRFSSNRFVFTDNWQGSGIKVWDLKAEEEPKVLVPEWHTAAINSHPGEALVAGVSENEICVWNATTLEEVRRRKRAVNDGWAGAVAYSHDGRFLAAAYRRYQVQIMDAKTLQTLAVFQPPVDCTVSGLSFSSDDRFLSVSDGTTLQVWNVEQVQQDLAKLELAWE